eukprot:6033138-Alexandrium_andersonii.AAC.1
MGEQAQGGRPRGARTAQSVLRSVAWLGSARGGHARHRRLQGPLPHGGRAGAGEGGQGALQAHHEPGRLGPATVGSPPGKW